METTKINFYYFLLLFSFSYIKSQNLNPFLNRKINYTESTETIKNPGMGYTTTFWLTAKPGSTKVSNHVGSLVLFFIDIGAFSSGINEEKVDYDLDSNFFESLKKNFEICRNNGGTIALRFRYDSNGKTNPEPETFDHIKKHISQIKNSGLLEEYKDIIMFVESGFVGAWGEQHSGKFCSLEYKVLLLDILLDVVPGNIPVTVRTPNIIAKWLNTTEDKLDTFVSEKGTKASRIGLFNDGYMGSDSDLGTYSHRENAVNFFSNQMRYTYFGGEFSGNIEWALKYDTYKPENSIKEMYKTHLSYINGNIFNLYNDYIFSKEYDVENVDNSAYYGQTVFKFIRDHLGYRLVLRNAEIQKEVVQGEIFEAKLIIENTGFANPIIGMNSELIMEKNGYYMTTKLDVDPTEFYSCNKKNINLKIKIPGEIEEGLWNIFLKLYIGNNDLNNYDMRSVKFANDGIYESSLGANFIGEIKVILSRNESIAIDRTFYQFNSNDDNILKKEFKLYNINKIIKINGLKSEFEWAEDLLLMEKDDKKLYVKNDDKFLYVMAVIKQNAVSPCVNIQINNNNKNYWFYYQTNGFIYFNEENYQNWLYYNNGTIFEFKIPFGEVMNINIGTKLKSIRVFIQDTSNEWKNCGEIQSGEYIIKDDFHIFTAFRNITLKEGNSFTMDVEISAENYKFQWILNGTNINEANNKLYKINQANENSIGNYSVNLTSELGESKIFNICQVHLYKEKEKESDEDKDDDDDSSNTSLIVIISIVSILTLALIIGIIIFLIKKKNSSKGIEKIEKQNLNEILSDI